MIKIFKHMKKITLLLAMVMMYAFASAQSVDEIIKKHIEKTGGEKAYSAIKSIKMKARMDMQGQSLEITDISTKDGKQYSSYSTMGMSFVQLAFDGEIAWHTDQSTMQPKKLGDDAVKQAKAKAKRFPSQFFDYKKKGYKIELEGSEKCNDEDCFKLKITPPVGEPNTSLISKKSYYEVGGTRILEQMGQKITVNLKMSDFKEVNGIMMSHNIVQSFMGQSMVLKIDSIEVNGNLDESIFTMK